MRSRSSISAGENAGRIGSGLAERSRRVNSRRALVARPRVVLPGPGMPTTATTHAPPQFHRAFGLFRRDRPRRRLDDRLRHLPRRRADDARPRSAGWLLAVLGAVGRHDGHGRGALRRSRRALPAGRRPVRLPPRGLRAADRLPLRLDALPRDPDGHHRRRRRGLRAPCRRPGAGPRRPRSRPGHLGRARARDRAHRAAHLRERPRRRDREAHPKPLHDRQGRDLVGADRPRLRARLLRFRGRRPISPLPSPAPLGSSPLAAAIGSAMVGALFSSDAWNNLTFASEEVRDPARTVRRALVAGTPGGRALPGRHPRSTSWSCRRSGAPTAPIRWRAASRTRGAIASAAPSWKRCSVRSARS